MDVFYIDWWLLLATLTLILLFFMLTSADFLEQLRSGKVITGAFDFRSHPTELMDQDFDEITFYDVEIHGGDFCSGIFKDCVFDNVLFHESALVGVSFTRCHFKQCYLNKVQEDFVMKDCKIGSFGSGRSNCEIDLSLPKLIN